MDLGILSVGFCIGVWAKKWFEAFGARVQGLVFRVSGWWRVLIVSIVVPCSGLPCRILKYKYGQSKKRTTIETIGVLWRQEFRVTDAKLSSNDPQPCRPQTILSILVLKLNQALHLRVRKSGLVNSVPLPVN